MQILKEQNLTCLQFDCSTSSAKDVNANDCCVESFQGLFARGQPFGKKEVTQSNPEV